MEQIPMNILRVALLALLLACPLLGQASSEEFKNDPAPINPQDKISLQRGARNFVKYCMGCHGAVYMRYSRLTDLGLTEQQIKQNLVLTDAKVGDTMSIAMTKDDAKKWFGVAPPDLSVIARSRGVDWLYTYLRSYYRDPSTATGWNNLRFPNVGMPHVLWQLQGAQALKVVEKQDARGHKMEERQLELVKQGELSPREYDQFVADLVYYLAYVGEPAKAERGRLGIVVLFFLGIFFFLALFLKKEYWKDVK
jgi:ubiquinol-cytochrome c reductase cytochrome c1 subunit